MDSWSEWAVDSFGQAQLGDVRRTARLVRMAAQAGRRPSGRLSEAFCEDAERQGAYDFVENQNVESDSIRAAMTAATARDCAAHAWVYIPLDGTSVKLWDGTGEKDFGAIGTYSSGATGLKLYNAIAVDPTGAPVGVAGQVWWRRPRVNPKLRRPSCRRSVPEKETSYLLECITQVQRDMAHHAPNTRCWFQLDRGCDARPVLQQLHDSGHWFTVRAQSDRRHIVRGQHLRWLKETLGLHPALGYCVVTLPRRAGRPSRQVRLAVRSVTVTLRLRDKRTKRRSELPINAVLVREARSSQRSRIEWLLLTNHPVATLKQAWQVVQGYTQRWRIEEYHKAWKTGACNVEQAQLHCSENFIRWATILSAVAARIERIKFLSRTRPDDPATIELTHDEIRALVLLRSRRKKRNETIPVNPSMGQAARWIAELGGYTGKSSGGPPGSITIARGFEVLGPAVEMLRILEPPAKLR